MALQSQSVMDPTSLIETENPNIVGDCAWTISSPDADEWIEAADIALFGGTQDQNAYRSKLAGQVKIASFLDALADTDLTCPFTTTPYHLILRWHLYCEKSWQAYCRLCTPQLHLVCQLCGLKLQGYFSIHFHRGTHLVQLTI